MSHLKVLFLAAVLLLLIFAEQGLARRGGGSRRGGSYRRTSGSSYSSSSSRRSSLQNLVVVSAAVKLARPRYRSDSTPDADFEFFETDDLDEEFNVNYNQYDTTFIAAHSKEDLSDCLIVPKNIDAQQCPAYFNSKVTNTTRFSFPDEFPEISGMQKNPISDINVCCGAFALKQSLLFVAVLTSLPILVHRCFKV